MLNESQVVKMLKKAKDIYIGRGLEYTFIVVEHWGLKIKSSDLNNKYEKINVYLRGLFGDLEVFERKQYVKNSKTYSYSNLDMIKNEDYNKKESDFNKFFEKIFKCESISQEDIFEFIDLIFTKEDGDYFVFASIDYKYRAYDKNVIMMKKLEPKEKLLIETDKEQLGVGHIVDEKSDLIIIVMPRTLSLSDTKFLRKE